MPTFLPSDTFTAGEKLTFARLNTAIGQGGALDFLKGALAAIGVTADSGSQTVDSGFIGCRLYSTGNLQVRDSAWTAIPWAAQRFGRFDGRDYDYFLREYPTFIHLPSSTTPVLNGTWLVGAHIEFTGNATGQRGVRLVERGQPQDLDATRILATRRTDSVGAGTAMALSILTLYREVGGANLTTEVFQDSGADLQINSSAAFTAEMWAIKGSLYPV